MSAHTPGEWVAEPYGEGRSLVYERRTSAKHNSFAVEIYGPRHDANARLIAAAPDLLEACRAALVTLDALVGAPPVEHPDVTTLRAAIAKATGGER